MFKKLGDSATLYVRTKDPKTIRNSSAPVLLAPDHLLHIHDLTTVLVKTLCSANVFKKAKRFEVQASEILSTQVYLSHNMITGSYKAVKIYDQKLTWGGPTQPIPFSLATLRVSCTCRYFEKSTPEITNFCKHIIGHLRRIIYITK